MPDISMCEVKDCQKSKECYRHKDSGTKPTEYRQAYILFPDWKAPENCEHFWPTHKNGKRVTP